MSISCLPSAFACQSSSASAKVWPCAWMQKSTWQVVPPNAAAVWPDSTSSIVTVPPNGMSRCVCGSTQPGSTYFPRASIVRVRRHVERLADQRDPLALDVDVGDVVVRRGDDPTALDQHRHGEKSSRAGARAKALRRRDQEAYLPPAVTLTTTALKPVPVMFTPAAFSCASAFFAYV